MTTAETLLDAGLGTMFTVHGEALLWRSGSGVVLTEHGEAVTTEAGKAIETGGGAEIDFTGIFDEEYALELPAGSGTVTTSIAVTARALDLPDAGRGDIIERDSELFYVNSVQPDGLGRIILLLSRHAH